MPIERQSRTAADIMADGMSADEPEMEETSEELVLIPASQLGGGKVAPGDVVRLEVVSIDDETGAVNARYAKAAEKKPEPEEMTIESAAAAFD